MKLPFLSLLALAAPALSHAYDHPVPPTLTLLFSANLTLGTPIVIGLTPFGEKLIVPIASGAFSGTKVKGKLRHPFCSSMGRN